MRFLLPVLFSRSFSLQCVPLSRMPLRYFLFNPFDRFLDLVGPRALVVFFSFIASGFVPSGLPLCRGIGKPFRPLFVSPPYIIKRPLQHFQFPFWRPATATPLIGTMLSLSPPVSKIEATRVPMPSSFLFFISMIVPHWRAGFSIWVCFSTISPSCVSLLFLDPFFLLVAFACRRSGVEVFFFCY